MASQVPNLALVWRTPCSCLRKPSDPSPCLSGRGMRSCSCAAPSTVPSACLQDALLASLQTLLEVHNISIPRPRPRKPGWTPPPRTLERFSNLRAVTVTNVYRGARAPSVPVLPVSIRELTLDALSGMRCGTRR